VGSGPAAKQGDRWGGTSGGRLEQQSSLAHQHMNGRLLLDCHDARHSRRIMPPLRRVLIEYVLRRANGYFIYSTVEGVRPHRGSAWLGC